MKRIIIVVDGGYAGTALARTMDDAAEVQLIEAHNCFVHNVAAIGAVADPSLHEQMIIDPEVVGLAGILPDERARYTTPEAFTELAQPPDGAPGPKLSFPAPAYAAILAVGDAQVLATASEPETLVKSEYQS